MIYFIRAGDYIKVGFSKNEGAFKYRLSSFKTSCPFDIEVIAKIQEWGVEEEPDIMNHFIEFHTKGEWFNYDISIEEFAKNPYRLPKSKFMKPLHNSNKVIDDNIEEIHELYKRGDSLREISAKFNVDRKRLIRYIPEEMKREKNEWFRLRRQEDNPKNIEIICTTTGERYISTAEASRILGISRSCIHKVIKGIRKQAKGLKFEVYEEFLKRTEEE